MRCSASSVKIKKINVSLTLKGKDIRRAHILNCLRPSVTLEGAGKRRTIVMPNWHQHSRNFYEEVEKAVKYFSGDSKTAIGCATGVLWKKIKAAVYAESRRKSTKERFESAYRKAQRDALLSEIKSSLTALSKKSIARYIRPQDLAAVWKQLQGERMVEDVMSS